LVERVKLGDGFGVGGIEHGALVEVVLDRGQSDLLGMGSVEEEFGLRWPPGGMEERR